MFDCTHRLITCIELRSSLLRSGVLRLAHDTGSVSAVV